MESRRFLAGHANARLLAKDKAIGLLELLGSFGELYGPVRNGGGSSTFRAVKKPADIDLNSLRTLLPPKKILYPPTDELLEFTADGGFRSKEETGPARIVLFGLHPCDINAVLTLDQVFSGRFEEPRYLARRRRTAVIGLDCLPDELCFCHSTKTDFSDRGFDLFLTDLGEAYFVRIGTALGDDIIRAGRDIFQPIGPESIDQYKDKTNRRHAAFSHRVELVDLPHILELDYDSEIWESLGRKCFSCGSCSAVCPTCYCYDVFDQVNLDGRSGSRVRIWDSCLTNSFARVADGHNYRQDKSTRIKLRYYHKQIAFVEQYGRPSCVGCGRCIAACPAEISVIDVLNAIFREKVVK
ncbi:MAG TPA: 4Fe-4S dicluster domain-containing protein [Bacillota bacterium]